MKDMNGLHCQQYKLNILEFNLYMINTYRNKVLKHILMRKNNPHLSSHIHLSPNF